MDPITLGLLLVKSVADSLKRGTAACDNCGTELRAEDVFCKKCGGTEKTTMGLVEDFPNRADRHRHLQEEKEKKLQEERLAKAERVIALKKDMHLDLQNLKKSKLCGKCKKSYADAREFCSGCGSQVRGFSGTELFQILREKYPTLIFKESDVSDLAKEACEEASNKKVRGFLGCIGWFILAFILIALGDR